MARSPRRRPRIEGRRRQSRGGGLASVGEAVLEAALHHVIVVQPTVGLHHFGLALTENRQDRLMNKVRLD